MPIRLHTGLIYRGVHVARRLKSVHYLFVTPYQKRIQIIRIRYVSLILFVSSREERGNALCTRPRILAVAGRQIDLSRM